MNPMFDREQVISGEAYSEVPNLLDTDIDTSILERERIGSYPLDCV